MLTEELIHQNAEEYSPYYEGELYNHLPMALWALKEMGASAARLQEFYDQFLATLEKRKPSSLTIDTKNFTDHFGDLSYERAYTEFFSAEIAQSGSEAILKKYLPRLMPGVSGAAFHSLIRIGYAMEMKSELEVAGSLATWVTSFLDLGSDSTLRGSLTMTQLLQKLWQGNLEPLKAVRGPNIAERIKVLKDLPTYSQLWPLLDPRELDNEKLESSLIWLFSQTNNFTILHTVTSHQAFMSLEPYFADLRAAKVHFWKGIWAGYLSTGPRALDFSWQYPDEPLPVWSELLRAAVASEDDHVIKLVYTCHQKFVKRPERHFHFAASRKLGLV